MPSRNIFADLGYKNPQEHLLKAGIASRIYDIISERGISQKEAAQLLSIDQPRVSDLLRGRFARFTTDKLFQFLLALGQNVEIVISPCRKGRKGPHLSVSASARRSRIHGEKAA